MIRWSYLLAGMAMCVAFFGLGMTDPGLSIGFVPSWTNSTPGELYTWLGIAFLVSPGAMLMGWGLAPLLEKMLPSTGPLSAAWEKGFAAFLLVFFGLGLLLARVGHQLVMHGFPLTDDEWAVRYAGQLMASGRLMEPVPGHFAVMPKLFLYVRDGMMTAFDWLGAIWPWALAELTHLGSDVYALFAAGTVVAVGAIIARRLSPSWALVAVVLFFVSPMATSLSMTTHAHLISRAFLAFSILSYLIADARNHRGLFFLTGLLAGIAWLTRPPEILMLWAPLGVLILVRAAKDPERRASTLWFVLGGLIPLFLFLSHSFAITGTWLPARMAPNDLPAWTAHHKPPLAFLSSMDLLASRLGANISYNLMMLAVWALGPFAVFFVVLGARRDALSKALALGILLALALGILHDDYGLHIVGPIHYSETIIPILILLVQGLAAFKTWFDERGLPGGQWTMAIIFGLVISNGFFAVRHLGALERQGRIHAKIYGYFDAPRFERSVVFGPEYGIVWRGFPQFAKTGSFVFQWRRVKPQGDERVVFLHMPTNPSLRKQVRAAYPERKFFVIRLLPDEPFMVVSPLKE